MLLTLGYSLANVFELNGKFEFISAAILSKIELFAAQKTKSMSLKIIKKSKKFRAAELFVNYLYINKIEMNMFIVNDFFIRVATIKYHELITRVHLGLSTIYLCFLQCVKINMQMLFFAAIKGNTTTAQIDFKQAICPKNVPDLFFILTLLNYFCLFCVFCLYKGNAF